MTEKTVISEVDWLVAGTGAAGMTGAVVANQLGGSVMVVEKEPVYGGTTAKSGGVAWIPGNHRLGEIGLEDSIEEGYNYLSKLVGDSVSASRLRAYAERAPEMLRFMMQHSAVEYTPLPSYMDYYEQLPGYKSGGRSMDPGYFNLHRLGREVRHMSRNHYASLMLPFNITVPESRKLQEMDWQAYLLGAWLTLRYWLDVPARLKGRFDHRVTLGPCLVARLRYSLLTRKVPVLLSTPMTQLLFRDGRVCGAIIEKDGLTIEVKSRRGVLLATGGFSQNTAMRQQYQSAPIGSDWTASAPGATGDGILMGQQLGAAVDFMGSAWWSPTYILPDGRILALIAGKAYPGSIMVNGQGKRFTNEAQPYEDLVKDQYASEARGEAAIPCYLVFDSGYRRKYTAGHIKPSGMQPDSKLPQEYFDSGMLTRAPSLRELAVKLGIDSERLVRTVNRFNSQARQGRDPDFGRGDSLHDRYYADASVQPNPSLGPLEQPPFYALRCEAGDLDTKGGLQCDEFGRVLDTNNQVIEGLYAAGNTSAAVMGDTYPGAGATIGSAMTFAYIAAQHAFSGTKTAE